jgi:hypothetical protein
MARPHHIERRVLSLARRHYVIPELEFDCLRECAIRAIIAVFFFTFSSKILKVKIYRKMRLRIIHATATRIRNRRRYDRALLRFQVIHSW